MSAPSKVREQRRRAREYEARKAVHELQRQRRGRDVRTALIALASVAVLAAAAQIFFFTGGPGGAPAETPPATAPDPSLAEGRDWTGTMTLNGVALGIQLDGAKAPQAVANMLALSRAGYYDGTPCHRLTTYPQMTVLQCGDPTGTGTGGPGYTWGPIENAPADNVYPAGTIAMARPGGNAEGMGSQFFIVFDDASIPSDAVGGYTVLGTVTSGLEELGAAVVAHGVADGSEDGAPATATTLEQLALQ